ncbi:hypothetical protein [Homoserinibacter sp. GY 40078]|uniref:hypothetical protein n=1 Tax=Homoserinibacter sp. GY 40078 TaxID=2603275 RepID=UPI0011C7A272|nr:hypothetical protein [Homoserinibacter sp. GY 40078]TXK19783.1 hypothetical protein FVQ89_07965 [Homoserinibacter sp. GY 40078]
MIRPPLSAFVITGVCLALAAGALTGIDALARDTARAEAHVEIDQAVRAVAEFEAARDRLDSAVDAAHELIPVAEEFAALVEVRGALDPDAAADAQSKFEAVFEVADGRGVATSLELEPPRKYPDVDPGMAEGELLAARDEARQLADYWRARTRAVSAIVRVLDDARECVQGAMAVAADSAPARAKKLVSKLAHATAQTKRAASAAGKALAEAKIPDAAMLQSYARAIAKLNDSHRKRLEAAEKAAREVDTSPGTTGGGKRSSGSTWRNGGSGSSSPGGAPSGGGSEPKYPDYTDTNRYVEAGGLWEPGCLIGSEWGRHDPGPGGTSLIYNIPYPYDYRIEGTWIVVYICR